MQKPRFEQNRSQPYYARFYENVKRCSFAKREVKSGDEGISGKTAEKFKQLFPKSKLLLVGKNGIPYETFMKAELGDIIAG